MSELIESQEKLSNLCNEDIARISIPLLEDFIARNKGKHNVIKYFKEFVISYSENRIWYTNY